MYIISSIPLHYFIVYDIVLAIIFHIIKIISSEVFPLREGEVLKLFRVVNGYDSLIDLSKASGLNKQTLSRAENNTAYISKATLQILADLYDVPFTALCLSFKMLEPLDYNIKKDRKKAYAYILSCPNKKK